MRFIKRSIASLLFICMLFTVMPAEVMTAAFADGGNMIGSTVQNDGPRGNENYLGGTAQTDSVEFRIVLSRNEKTYLNGTDEQRNKVVSYYKSRWPNDSDLESNTIYLISPRTANWFNTYNSIPSGHRRWVAQYKPGEQGLSFFAGYYRSLLIDLTNGNPGSSVPDNPFKEDVMNAYYNGDINSLSDLAVGNKWLDYMPSASEAMSVLNYIFAQVGGSYQVDSRLTNVIERKTTHYNFDVENNWSKDPSLLDADRKMDISAGYVGLLTCLYSVITSTYNYSFNQEHINTTDDEVGVREKVGGTYFDAINDYLLNANSETKPVSLIIDTASGFVYQNDKNFILADIDYLQFVGLAEQNEALTNPNNQILANNSAANGNTRQLLTTMYNMSLNRKSWKDYYAGRGPSAVVRYLDYYLGRMGEISHAPMQWAYSAQFFDNQILRTRDGGAYNGQHTGTSTSDYSGKIEHILFDGTKGSGTSGFMIIGNHFVNPVPEVSYHVDSTVDVLPKDCDPDVNIENPSVITVSIKGDSSLISSLNSRKDNPNFEGIKIDSEIYRTVYKNGWEDGNIIDARKQMSELENQLDGVINGDDMIAKLQNEPFILRDTTIIGEKLTRDMGAGGSYRYKYEINIDVTIDKQTYEFKYEDIVLKGRGGADRDYYDFAEINLPAYTNMLSKPEDIIIVKPTSTDTTEIVDPSKDENLRENTQMVKRMEFSSSGEEFAEIKSNVPLNEEYEVMGGIPSSEEIYFSVGGSEFKLALVMQYWMNEHSRDRTYTVHFDGNICEYNNDIEGQGDRLPLTHPILQPTGGSYDDQDIKCNNENHTGDFDNTIVAKWTGTDQCSVVENGTCSDCGKKLVSSCTVADGIHPNYDKAMEQAKEYAQKLGQEYVVWTAASDGKLRQVLWTPSNPEDDDTHDHVYHGTNGTSGSSCGGNHSSCSSTSSKHSHRNTNCVYGTPCNTAHAYTIIVTSTIPKHSICGPCCGHHMPELWDTWRQGLVYDFAKISQVRLFKLDQGSVDGLQELTGVDTVFANVISGNPTYFMNIAQMTEKQTKNGTVLPDGYDSTVNDSTKGLNEFDGHILTYFSGQNRQLAQSSRAGRLRYTLAEGQTTETITITEQGNGTGGTYTFDPNLIAAPNQHDDVIYNAGARSKNCDGMATTANFGKKDTENVVPMLTTGHVNEWADGCLYTNILNRTVHQLPDGFGMSKNTSAYSGYWDCDLYSATTDTQNFEANTLQTYSNNDEHITKYKEDYNHHVVREDVLSGVSTELKKTAYNDAADEIDTQTAEWQFFDKARRTKVVANVISDFLILQTSGGDQSIFYYEKASEPTEAQEHFQKVKIDENELFLNNPLSLFTGDMNCNSTDVKSTHTANFIMVGGYNGQYNKPTEKYKPYNPQEGVFKNFGGNNGANWTNYNTRTKQGSYNVLGNHSITTILDEDPAKTITRPKRQVTCQDDSFKIVQTGIQILPTAPNKLYTPENAKVFYSEVLGYYSIDKERFDREAGTYDIVTTSGNVSIGWPQQVSHGDYYQEYWGNKNGVDYSTLYFKTPIGDSSTGTVNSLVVFTPVSTEEAMVMNQPDLDINGMKVSRDQRTNAFEYPNMNDLVNKLKVCPLDPELCEFRFLDCKFHKDTVLLDIDFEDTYMEKEIRRVKQEDGSVKETVKEIGLRENATRYDETLKRWITTNKVNGVEYILPEGFTIGQNGSVGSGGYLRANGTRWSLPFSEFGLSNANTNRITVKMDITVNSWANNLMPVSFHNLGFLLNNGSGKTGSFITKSPLDNSQIGARMDVGTSQLPNNITLEMTFSFNNVVDCNAVVNGVYVPLTVSDLKDVWQPDANGVRRLNRTQKSITPTSFTRNEINKVETPQNWIDEQPSCYTKKDIGSNLNIGGWSQDDAYKANFSIDNLQVILKGGTNTHSSICYERLTVHATNKIHVHDEDCYLKEDLFTCDGDLNSNYQLNCGKTTSTTECNNLPLNSGKSAVTYYEWTCYTVGCCHDSDIVKKYFKEGVTPTYSQLCGNSHHNGAYKTGNSEVRYEGEYTSHIHTTECYHKHLGVAGKNYPNGCYTKPTAHTHNMIPLYNVCGKTEGTNESPIDFAYANSMQQVTLQPGEYEFEVWGAEGGYGYSNSNYIGYGGKGGYSKATVSITTPTTYYIYTGGKGSSITTYNSVSGGYNGGGSGYGHAGGGGGATHIATSSGLLSSLSNNKGSIILVAGGGGGGQAYSSYKANGGVGGGSSGGNGNYHSYWGYSSSMGKGGSQTAGGINPNNNASTYNGTFGQGGQYYYGYVGGGGGGYYGGSSGGREGTTGGGGSGYIKSGLTGSTLNGSQTFKSPTGTDEVGHSGNGYARITPKNHVHTDDCFESALLTGTNTKELICNIPVGGDGQVRTYGTGGNTYNPTNGYGSTSTTLPAGRYKFEVWGAEGGRSYSNTQSNYGSPGLGGYSVGEITFNTNTTVYVYVGGKGVGNSGSSAGGYNGGGTGYDSSCGSGGGATHIATRAGLLSSLSSYKSDVLIVAGGGGGTEYDGQSSFTRGGYGGGSSGTQGLPNGGSNYTYCGGNGGTQSAGGTIGSYASGGNVGSFGQGGNSTTTHSGGGGGGWYGGASGNTNGGGGGGSGYVGGMDSGTTYVGNTSFSNTAGTGNETGHSGNGFVKITNLDHQHTDACYKETNITIPDGYMAIPKCNLHSGGDSTVREYSTAGAHSVSLPAGQYKLEVWGAQGGAFNYHNNSAAGKGGYSSGVVTFNSTTTVYIGVGGKGTDNSWRGSGGYNGGGTGSAPGGGATHIATSSGTLSSLSSNTSSILIVAGGGAGSSGSKAGGNGGSAVTAATAGVQHCGTAGGAGTSSSGGSSGSCGTAGTFGQGGSNTCSGGGTDSGSGGGGGYYGGGAGGHDHASPQADDSSGGGGSGYAKSTLTEVTGTTGTRTGNGLAKITGLGHTHTSACFDIVPIPKCETLKKGSLACTGELNTETDFNVHIHTAECLTTTATFDEKWFMYTGGVQTFVVPYTDYYIIEAYGPTTTTNGRSGYSKVRTHLKANTVLYIYVGGIGGTNNYTTDVRTYPLPNGSDNVDGNNVADLTAVSDKTKLLYANRTTGGKGENSACAVQLLQTGARGNSENGRVIITCENTAMEDIYNKIITGQMTHEEAKKYLGETVYNKIMEGKEGLLHTWEDWTYNNTKGFTEVQNSKLLYGGSSLICGKTENDTGTPIDFDYSGHEENITLPAGTYKLEVWGAQGGSSESKIGGLGGYSVGELTLNSSDTLYINVGGQGGASSTAYGIGGYNGGGDGENHSSDKGVSAGGGGATHIGLKSGLLTTFSSDYTTQLLMVAGGGGGVGDWTDKDFAKLNGGYGGGEKAGDGETYASESRYGGKGATSTGIVQNTTGSYASENGSFGKGGSVPATSNTLVGGGGGGGLYGGGSGGGGGGAGGGGSGYVNTTKLNSATTTAGNVSFTSPTGTSETGHSGNGYARITPLSHTHTDECYGGGVGGYNCGLDENSEEIVKEFSYKGSIENITLSAGKYKLEVWGAQGGGNTNYPGGKGGYSYGVYTVPEGTTKTIYVAVGSEPQTIRAGGYNGGGVCTNTYWTNTSTSYSDESLAYGTGGGGATHIGLKSGLLSTFSGDYTTQLLLVAGGGGGNDSANADYSTTVGYGGGSSGAPNAGGISYDSNRPSTATQNSGYSFGVGQSTSLAVGAGGGGLYGGYAGYTGTGTCNTGGGGSGYVNTNVLDSGTTTAGNVSFTSPTGTSETGHSGNGYARITRLGHTHTEDCGYSSVGVGGGGTATTLTCGIPVGGDGQVRTYGTVGASSVTLGAGRYRIEVWGAQGGNAASSNYTGGTGGKGGYSVGEVTLNQSTTYQIIVGGQGQSYNTNYSRLYGGNGGFGAGGAGGQPWMGATTSAGAGGGGLSGVFTSTSYTSSALIIAGGGGGGGGSAQGQSSNHGAGTNGGYGGGEIGGTGVHTLSGTTSVSHKSQNSGKGGTQSAGGAATNQNSVAGGKLYGGGGGGYTSGGSGNPTTLAGGVGSTSYNSSSSAGGSGGGGGGYYGGSGGGQYGLGGGGGSGYVNLSLLDSGTTYGGNTLFSNTAGTGNETGHSGNGFVKITTLDHQHTDACYTTVQIPDGYVLNCDKTKDHVHSMAAGCFIEFVGEDGLTVISSGNPAQFEVPLGNINVEAISKIVVYSKNCPNTFGKIYLKDDTGTYNENDSVTSNTITPNTENQVMTFILQDNPNFSGEFTSLMFELANVTGRFNISKIEVYGYGEKIAGTGDGSGNAGGTPMNFDYTGKTQAVSLNSGTYKLEVWGAEGGTSSGYAKGGKGGYSVGTLSLKQKTTLYVNVGQVGINGGSGTREGWNGGAAPLKNHTFNSGGGGGTDISLYGTNNTTTWNTTEHLYSRIIVAGGGGGGGAEWGSSYEYAGAGGGLNGQNAGWNGGKSSASTPGQGGTQTSAGGPAYGGFGYGGKSTTDQCGSGGGGWYGGGSQTSAPDAGGGGGSGYVYTASTASNYPSGCRLNSNYYLTNANTIAGTQSFTSPTGASEIGHTGNGYARITPLNTFTPLEINYRDPFDGSSTIILANIDSIPDKLDGDYNPIWKCKFKEPNAHACVTTNDNGLEIVHCKTHVIFNCSEVHHRGEHYNVSNRICWSACGDDANHANTKTETKDKEGNDVKLAEFLQLDAAFTVYFPNVGDFEGNDALGLSKPQVERGYGYDDNMDTTDWTREKRVKFPFDVIYHNKKTNKYEIHRGNAWIELDVPTVYFNFYILASNAEMQNVPVEFEVEAINGGTNSGVKPKRNIEYDSNIIDKKYEDALKNFRDNYVSKLKDSISGGYKIPYPNVTGTNSSSGVDRAFNDSGYWSFYSTKQSSTGLDGVLRAAIDTINKQIENDFEGNTSSDSYIDPHENQGKTGVNNKLKKVTGNDNKIMLSNRRRSNSLESLHGGYKEFYLDVIGRIGNFALVDTEDYRFSEFFKVPVVSNTDLGALADEDNWLIEGAVLNVNPALQNYYVGDSFDIRGNEASLEAVDSLGTHYLNTYNTQSWMQGLIGADGKRDMSKPNLVSQILTSDLIHNRILKGEELRFGYDAYTSIVTLGSYTGARVQVVPKYFAMKLNDNPSEILDTKGQVVNANDFIPLDVYISKEGTYLPINIYGNAANGNPNINEYTLNGYSMNLDWTTEGDRRNYGIDEQGITNDVKAHLTRLDYGDRAEGSGGSFDSTPPLNTPDEIKLIIPEGKNNYLGTAQYMLMSDRHRTFIGSSVSFGGNTYKSRAGTSEWGDDKDPDNIIPDNLFKMAVQRWHGKLGVPSSAVFVPHAYKATGTPIADRNTTTLTPVNSETTSWVMNDDWAIICTAEIIAVGDVWSIYYSQPWFKTMTVSGQMYNTVTVGGEHYPGHRVYNDNGQSEECPHCLPPIIAIYSSDSSSVDDVEIVQTH